MASSSNGLGNLPFKQGDRGSNPLGATNYTRTGYTPYASLIGVGVYVQGLDFRAVPRYNEHSS